MKIKNLKIERLNSTHDLKDFKCEIDDLNDFLINDAILHQKELLTVTYLFNIDLKLVAFLSLSNDTVHEELFPSKNSFKLFRKTLPEPKRYRHLPAVKIGRFGVNSNYNGQGIGSQIIDIVKNSFTINNKTGCRFITIDAYNNPKTLSFYQKNGFEFFKGTDKEQDTRAMYFDLIKIDSAKSLQPLLELFSVTN
jgi:hypothetical protein